VATRTRAPGHEILEDRDPIAPEEYWGEVGDAVRSGTVDGDFNGAPDLASVEESRAWEGRDTVDAAERTEAGDPGCASEPSDTADLADRVAQRREMVRDRLDEARMLGVGDAFETALAATTPGASGAPDPLDPEVLLDQLRLLDAAIEQLERR
jgi:hypothetical protein